MALINGGRTSPFIGAVVLFVWVLTQASLSAAGTTVKTEFEFSFSAPNVPKFSLPPLALPQLPQFSLPPLALPQLPQFSLPTLPHLSLPQFSIPPLPSHVTLPGLTVPGFSIPPLEPLEALNLPKTSFDIPGLPGLDLPETTIIPPFAALKIPEISVPPLPARKVTFDPSDFTIPGFTFQTISVPPTTFPFPRRAFPRARAELKN